MFKNFLVSELIAEAKNLIEALDRDGFPVAAAFWFKPSDSDTWRLTIATPLEDKIGPMASYSRVNSVLEKLAVSQLSLTDISIVSPRDQDFQYLRFKAAGPGGPTLGAVGGPLANQIFQDSYIYRI
jgi:hypothetical protein